MNARDRMAQALLNARAAQDPTATLQEADVLNAQAVAPPPVAPPDPYVLDQQMEAAAQPDSPPIHPIIGAIMQKMGLLNVIRNRRNAALGGNADVVPMP